MTKTIHSGLVGACASAVIVTCGLGCDGSSGSQQEEVAKSMRAALMTDIDNLHQAAIDLRDAAPTPAGRGWSATTDATAITAMKAAWIRARVAYEHIEGAIAPIFPDIDVATDERYDGFLAEIGPAGDQNLFDGEGVTGMHAIERVLYADSIPSNVVAFEASLPGYKPAAFPASEAEAAEFRTGLATQLVTDTATLQQQWKMATNLDVSGAFQGLIGLMNEQLEKVNNAATGEEESRYSQRTMADLRANLDGTTMIYSLFRSWLRSRPAMGALPSGTEVDGAIMSGFGSLDATYGTVAGDAIPTPPATWSAETPSPADLTTPFGTLYQTINEAVDPSDATSVVGKMNQGAMLLGIPGFEG